MLNCYRIYYTTKLNGETIYTSLGYTMCEEHEMHEEHISITWDNLADFYQRYGLVCGFNIWNFRKGRRIGLFHRAFSDRKEWKHSETGLTFDVTFRQYEPTIQDLFNDYNATQAVQYLNERNLQKPLDKLLNA